SAGVQQGGGDQGEALWRAVDDEDLLGPRLHPEAEQVAGEVLAQRRIARGLVVLEELATLLADHAIERAAERVRGEQRAVRHAAGERDDTGGRPHDVAVGRTAARVPPHDLPAPGEQAGPLEP